MASFIARMFGGGKSEEAPKPAPAPVPEPPKPETAPEERPRMKTQTKYGGMMGKSEEAKMAKKMLLGE